MSSFSVEQVSLIKVNTNPSSDYVGKILDFIMEKKIYSTNLLVSGPGMYYALHKPADAEVLRNFILDLGLAVIE
jgi:hypothetical protein